MSDGLPQAGWYADPEVPGQLRWWDGRQWTDRRHPAPQATAPQVPQGPAAGATGAGGYAAPGAASGRVDTWLWQSIVATILCCLPLGVAGIVFAAQAQSAINVGDLADAREKARLARIFTLWAVGVSLASFFAFFLLMTLGLVAGF